MTTATLRPFFCKISGSKFTPISINAIHSIDAAKKIMRAQPDLWRDNPRITSVSVRDGELGPERHIKCASVLNHFTAQEIQDCNAVYPVARMRRVNIVQASLFESGTEEDERDEVLDDIEDLDNI